jgi:hypothetical protein
MNRIELCKNSFNSDCLLKEAKNKQKLKQEAEKLLKKADLLWGDLKLKRALASFSLVCLH